MDFKRLTSRGFFPSLIFAREAAWSSCFLDASDDFFLLLLLTPRDSLSLSVRRCSLPRVMKGVGSFLPCQLRRCYHGAGDIYFFPHAAVPGVENRSSRWRREEEEEKLIILLGVKKSLVM